MEQSSTISIIIIFTKLIKKKTNDNISSKEKKIEIKETTITGINIKKKLIISIIKT